MPILSFTIILPEIFLACVGMALLMIGAFRKENEPVLLSKMAITMFIVAGILIYLLHESTPATILNGLFILDGFALFSKGLILLAALLVLSMSLEPLRGKEKVCFEFPVLIIMSVVGMMIMVSANDLISLYMGLELQSLSLYILAAIRRTSEKSSEAGLKYFILGALSSGMLLYGCSMIYGFAGTTGFTQLAQLYSDQSPSIGALTGIIFVIIGICFKISAAPFHMWTPDVYEGAPKAVTSFFATAPKVAAMALLMRLIMQPFGGLVTEWQQVVIFVSVASMVVGAFGALKQTNIKRLMAYSSIGHVGFVLVGLASGVVEGVQAALIYAFIYVTMNVGVFACIIMMRRRKEHVVEIRDLSGVARQNPMFAAVMTILMLSMAGIPPLAGFFGKFFVFKAALEQELYILAVIGVLSSVVAAFYYLRIIKVMYFDKLEDPLDDDMSIEIKLVLWAAGLFNLLFFIAPAMLLDIAKLAAKSLF